MSINTPIFVSLQLCTPSILMYTCMKISTGWQDSKEVVQLRYAEKYLTFLNGLLTPVIYCALSPGFKSALRRMMAPIKSRRAMTLEWDHQASSRCSKVSAFKGTGYPKIVECQK